MSQIASTNANRHEIVTCTMAGQSFCFRIEHILEIRGWSPTTLLPRAPDYVKGLMNLRGNVLPVVDLSLRLGLGACEPTPRHVVIIVRIGTQTVGFIVDSVSNIVTVEEGDLRPTPDTAGDSEEQFIDGVYILDGELVRALNIFEILPFLNKIECQQSAA